MTQFKGGTNNLALVVYGDDYTTDATDGMSENEMMNFVVFTPATNNTINTAPQWNQSMTHTGMFAVNGLSMITGLKNSTDLNTVSLNAVNIYPNPNTGFFHIDGINGKVDIQILNATGQLIRVLTADQSIEINLSNFAKGIYYLKLVSENDIMIEKIIVE